MLYDLIPISRKTKSDLVNDTIFSVSQAFHKGREAAAVG